MLLGKETNGRVLRWQKDGYKGINEPHSKGEGFILRQKLVRSMGMTCTVAFVLLAISVVCPISLRSNEAEGTAGIVSIPTITMTTGHESADVDLVVSSSSGSFASSTSDSEAQFTVSTDNYTGYTLTIAGSDDTRQLSNTITTSDKLNSISAATSADIFATGSGSTYNGKWGYKPSKYNSLDNTNFLQAPTTTAETLNHTTCANGSGGTCTSATDTYTIAVGARADHTKPTGIYTNTFVLTATANPVAYAINYYDGIDNTTPIATQASENNALATITLNPIYTSGSAPTRTTYTFAGWCRNSTDHTQVAVNATTQYDATNKVYHNKATMCNGELPPSTSNDNFIKAGDTSLKIDPTIDNTNISLYAVWAPTTFDQAYAAAGKTKDATSGYNYYKMQDMTASICAQVSPNEVTTLVDTRTNTISGTNYASRDNYTIIKLEDNRCWMADNLNLDLTSETVAKSLTETNTHATSASINILLNGDNNTTDGWANKGLSNNSTYAYANWVDSYSYSEPLVNRSGTCDSSKNISAPCVGDYQDNPYTYDTIISEADAAKTKYNYGPGTYKIGTYYNYCAASAGSYCWGDGTDSGSHTESDSNAYITNDICPAGWKMPRSGTVTDTSKANYNEYQILYDTISANYPSTEATATSPYSLQSFLSTPLSGRYGSATAYVQGTYGYFWSSTYHNERAMCHLRVSSTRVVPQSTNARNSGKSVRCIAQN